MYCPSCGTKGSTGQKFCRSCGKDVHMISKIVAGRLPAADSDKAASDLDKATAHRMIKFMSWGGIILFVGLVALVLGKKYLHDNLLELVGGLITLAGAFVMAYGLFSAMLSATKDSRQFQRKDAQTQPHLDGQLPLGALPEPMLLVTERTTRLMETIDARPSEGKPRDESSA
jgi:hypothetical protein